MTRIERPSKRALGYRITNSDPDGRFALVKDVITDPHYPCLLQYTRLTGDDEELLSQLRLYILCDPHLEVGGWANNGKVVDAGGRPILMCEKRGTWLALAATVPFSRASCGYVGQHRDTPPGAGVPGGESIGGRRVSALICAACFARERGDEPAAQFLEEYADFLEAHVERWTVTRSGTLVDGIARHYIRVHPVSVGDHRPDEDADHGVLTIANQPPGTELRVPARDVVDAGFLELVRYGIRRRDDPLIVDSLRVVDAVLKAETPFGPAWRRYNHDAYGQRDDGGPYVGWGKGRAWPLLTGERGHYELAAGRDVSDFIRTMERFATSTGLLPEQVWDEADRPEVRMYRGRPTGSATPLMWAHAEYIKLLRSVHDGQVFDRISELVDRYRSSERRALEIWKPNRQVRSVRRGFTLRVQAPAPFRLRWTMDDWQTIEDTPSTGVSLGIAFVDIEVAVVDR